MRSGSVKSSFAPCLLLALGACSNIIGISSYEIDPALDEAQPSLQGGDDAGGSSSSMAGEPGQDASGTGGASPADGGDAGTGPGGTNAAGGDPGGGGEPPIVSGCKNKLDCDDEIDCTVDVCGDDGKCSHEASDAMCDSTRCETCKLGIGCVAGATTSVPLITDGSFEKASSDWSQSSDRESILTSPTAQSGTKLAQFGPGPTTGTDLDVDGEYDDLSQAVEIPADAVAVTLTGYYKLTPGTHLTSQSTAWAALYEGSDLQYTALFHKFPASLGAKTDWGQPFSYSVSKSDLKELIAGQDFSFYIVATIWDSTYQFDNLQLTATVCGSAQ